MFRLEQASVFGEVPQKSEPDVAMHVQTKQRIGVQWPFAKTGKSFLEKAVDTIGGNK